MKINLQISKYYFGTFRTSFDLSPEQLTKHRKHLAQQLQVLRSHQLEQVFILVLHVMF